MTDARRFHPTNGEIVRQNKRVVALPFVDLGKPIILDRGGSRVDGASRPDAPSSRIGLR